MNELVGVRGSGRRDPEQACNATACEIGIERRIIEQHSIHHGTDYSVCYFVRVERRLASNRCAIKPNLQMRSRDASTKP
jgi:hypothetical protein